ncbi:hypothetical protein PRIPAC_88418 [Pristionchus pacificus]|uniref:Uncharacterized protein n=1 Tax=Pristionchus pacificus TaxID=54126 RepID=A0A2A6B8L1_PRIPA|nr:hypothetical protein PRIPAC_88418 [Pristionchus pacificus]|eukprot:PDM62193.1 hypothetical protein PRIPAC_51635 [Pristionchus pacificus]
MGRESDFLGLKSSGCCSAMTHLLYVLLLHLVQVVRPVLLLRSETSSGVIDLEYHACTTTFIKNHYTMEHTQYNSNEGDV